jgi:hypothetical protein
MVPLDKVDRIRRLLAEGRLSQRQIAPLVGVSRGVVVRIASGKRPDYAELQRARSRDDLDPKGPFVHCTGCGHEVQLPCQICLARAARASRAIGGPRGRRADPPDDLRLDLHGEALARYEQLRSSRSSGCRAA